MFILFPHARFNRITDILPENLAKSGVLAIVLDVDNTLTTHDHPIPAKGVREWLVEVKKEKIQCIILSNNSTARVLPFASDLGLPFIAKSRKPLPFAFLKASEKIGVPPSKTAVIGDQLFTDILGGRIAKMYCIYVNPIEPEAGVFFRCKRFFERLIFKFYQQGSAM